MKYQFKLMLLFLISHLLYACKPKPEVVPEFKQCIPEAELSQNGIVNGVRVFDNTKDANEVVMLLSKRGSDFLVCTASAIAPNVLITAAHCITAEAKDTRVGLHASASCESGFVFINTMQAQDIAVNSKFKQSADSGDDVALVFLSENLPSRFKIHQIALPSEQKGKDIQFFGYGSIGYEKGGSLILRKTKINSSSIEVKESSGVVHIDQSNGTGVCTGDSGGPGLIDVNGQKKILSINSKVYRGLLESKEKFCSSKALLTLVHPHLSWIKSELAKRFIYLNE